MERVWRGVKRLGRRSVTTKPESETEAETRSYESDCTSINSVPCTPCTTVEQLSPALLDNIAADYDSIMDYVDIERTAEQLYANLLFGDSDPKLLSTLPCQSGQNVTPNMAQACHPPNLAQTCHPPNMAQSCHPPNMAQTCHPPNMAQPCHPANQYQNLQSEVSLHSQEYINVFNTKNESHYEQIRNVHRQDQTPIQLANKEEERGTDIYPLKRNSIYYCDVCRTGSDCRIPHHAFEQKLGRNRLNLRINTGAYPNNHNTESTNASPWFSKEGLLRSPVLSNLSSIMDLGWSSPSVSHDRKVSWIVCVISVLLVLLIAVIIVLNVVPYVISAIQESRDNQETIRLLSSARIWKYKETPPKLSTTTTKSHPEQQSTTIPFRDVTKLFMSPEKTTSMKSTTVVNTVTTSGRLPTTTVTQPTSTWQAVLPSTWLPTHTQQECTENKFQCKNGVSRVPCLFPWNRCDGIQDCSDGSDELFCEELQCYGNYQCSSMNECIALEKACNGVPECSDGSDEWPSRCGDNNKCQDYEFHCASGYCIPKQWICDGDADCPGHEDERHCSTPCSKSTQFSCVSSDRCIDLQWHCNGIHDCSDGSDELNCPNCTQLNQKQCNNNGQCFDGTQSCDGVKDCADGSDEWNCVSINEKRQVTVTVQSIPMPLCADSWTSEYSNQLCNQLGHPGYQKHRFTELPSNTSYVAVLRQVAIELNNQRADTRSLRKSRASECESKQIVSIDCLANDCDQSIVSPSVRQRRMIGGHASGASQWPSVGVLYHSVKMWTCTVTVLNAHWLLTSANCIKRTDLSTSNWHISVGSNKPLSAGLAPFAVDKFVFHPNYKFKTPLVDFDVALIRVKNEMKGISPVCLPINDVQDNAICYTAGWGYTDPGGFMLNHQLLHLSMRLVPTHKCNSSLHYDGHVTARMLCAQSQSTHNTPCYGDEGSPLLCHGSNTWFIAGSLSAHTCGSHRPHPAVYTNIRTIIHWVWHHIHHSYFPVSN